jgi:hypothetical protein
MKKQILVFSLLIIPTFFFEAYAQNTFPDETISQKWEYLHFSFWDGASCQKRIIKNGIKKDICEGQYIEIWDCNEYESNCRILGYYRKQGDSVLVRRASLLNNLPVVDCSLPYGLTYDFGTEIDEHLQCATNMQYLPFQRDFWTTEIQEKLYEGQLRKTIEVNFRSFADNDSPINDMLWIEGIGSNHHPFYSLVCMGHHCEDDYKITKVFRNNELIFLDTLRSSWIPCRYIPTGTKNEFNQQPRLTVYPNPASDFVKIQKEGLSQDPAKLSIFDALGREQKIFDSYVFGEPLAIDFLNTGVYIIKVSIGTQSQYLKIFKE